MSIEKDNFYCEKCNMAFSKKYTLDRHLGKRICKDQKDLLNITVEKKEKNINCIFCNKAFEKKSKLERHLLSNRGECYKIRSGYQKSIIINNNNQKIDNRTINNITNNNQTTINNQTIINNQINVQPIIVLAKPGEETISHITKDVMLEILDIESFPKMCTELMRLLYFNKDVPENSNWTIVYPKNKNAGIEYNHTSGRFERKSTHDIVDDKFSNMINLLFDLVQEISRDDNENNTLSKRQKININKYGMHFGQLDISKTSKDVYDSIHSMAFSSRKSQMKVWKNNGHEGNHLSLKF